ncbi:MAG: TonB family protein [Bacteroidota bacterium]
MDDISKKLAQINSYIGKMENAEQDKRLKKVSRLVAVGVGVFLLSLALIFPPLGLFESSTKVKSDNPAAEIATVPIDTLVVYVKSPKAVGAPVKLISEAGVDAKALGVTSKQNTHKTPPSHNLEEGPSKSEKNFEFKKEVKKAKREAQTGKEVARNSKSPVSKAAQPVVMRSADLDEDSPKLPEDLSIPVESPDVDPRFPGGRAALSMFIQKHVTYPEVPREDQKEGTVYVRFTVDELGSIKNPHIIRGLGEAYDKEALSLIDKMPRWVPGKMQNKSIASYKSLGIMYKIY